jgi:hypothetical protein
VGIWGAPKGRGAGTRPPELETQPTSRIFSLKHTSTAAAMESASLVVSAEALEITPGTTPNSLIMEDGSFFFAWPMCSVCTLEAPTVSTGSSKQHSELGQRTLRFKAKKTLDAPQRRARKLMHGCRCATGCTKGYCACRKAGRVCGPLCQHARSCRCTNRDALTVQYVGKQDDVFCHCSKTGCRQKYCPCLKAGRTCGKRCVCKSCTNCTH